MSKLSVVILLAGWPLLPFVKQDAVNPILGPGGGRFMDPIMHREVAWEEKEAQDKPAGGHFAYRAGGKR